jgi:type I restriction enzyme R subunit
MGKNTNPQDLSDDEARNKTDKITGRITKMIEQDLAEDPYAQEYFSKLLKQAIADAKAMFDTPVKNYLNFVDFEEKLKTRSVAGMPKEFQDNKQAQAYYGLFKHLFKEDMFIAEESNQEKLIKYAFDIDKIIKQAVAEFSINPAEIENAISIKLLPMLFADLGLDKAQVYTEEVLKVTRLGISRS